ncbi:ATP-binding protein [Candidatus Woesearchaeota archaeon]|nr:ATP-binding protein [Candidatus Woesearchaeota archaeon]
MKTITVLSGKGGVGKSSITASLAVAMSRKKKIISADCDVDASNLALVLGAEKHEEWKPISTNQKAKFDLKKCNSCKKCFNSCFFNAIEWINNKPRLKEFSCEGCGLCKMICPAGAITEIDINNAKLGYSKTKYGFIVVSAQLNIGESGSGKIVSEVKNKAGKLTGDADFMIVDSAAGIGCPVIASVTGSDYAVIVVEPTPSSFSDMQRAMEIVDHFRIPIGIIINKFDINPGYSRKIESFSKKNDKEILTKIPYDKKFVDALVNLTPIIVYDEKFKSIFDTVAEKLIKMFSDE